MNKRPTEREELLLKVLKTKPQTTNEVIKKIFKKDLKAGEKFIVDVRGWKFYVHLNKCFAPMERKELIEQVGEKTGETGKVEKLWSII